MLEHQTDLAPLPAGWIPEGAVLFAVAKHYTEDKVWEVVLPEFGVVGRGDTFSEASRQAGELLDDYFRLCARDGVSFAKAKRPMSAAWYAREIAGAAVDSFVRRVRHTSARIRILRLPADPALN